MPYSESGALSWGPRNYSVASLMSPSPSEETSFALYQMHDEESPEPEGSVSYSICLRFGLRAVGMISPCLLTLTFTVAPGTGEGSNSSA